MAIGLVLLCQNPGYATLTNADLATPGDNLLVQDSSTGLEWLSMNPTRGALQTSDGVSVNQILSGFGGYIADGFQFATLSQVMQLFQDAGITDFTGTYGTADLAGTELLLSLFGNVDADPVVRVVQGFAGVDLGAGTADVPAVAFIPAGDPRNPTYSTTNQDVAVAFCLPPVTGCVYGLDTTPSVGAFLVRSNVEEVPEPTTLAIVTFGLLAFGWTQRRKRSTEGGTT